MPKPLHILLVEDDEVDTEYMLRSLQRYGNRVKVVVAQNGLEALDILQERHNIWHIEHPCLVFTDLNMPQMTGLELLQALRQDPKLRHLVVYVVTSSNLDADKSAAYAYQVAGYLLKAKLDQALPQFFQLFDFYSVLNEFPPTCE